MDSSVSPKDEIWFLRVCHHISNAVYDKVFYFTNDIPHAPKQRYMSLSRHDSNHTSIKHDLCVDTQKHQVSPNNLKTDFTPLSKQTLLFVTQSSAIFAICFERFRRQPEDFKRAKCGPRAGRFTWPVTNSYRGLDNRRKWEVKDDLHLWIKIMLHPTITTLNIIHSRRLANARQQQSQSLNQMQPRTQQASW